MWWNLVYSLMEYGGAIISVFMIILLLAFLYGCLLPANGGTMMGIGVGGCIGVIGIACGHLGMFIGIALGMTLGGFIGSGIQWHNDVHRQDIRENQQRMLNEQRKLNEQRMLNERQMLNEQRKLQEQQMLNEKRMLNEQQKSKGSGSLAAIGWK